MRKLKEAIERIEFDIDSCIKGKCHMLLKNYKTALRALKVMEWIMTVTDCSAVECNTIEYLKAKFNEEDK